MPCPSDSLPDGVDGLCGTAGAEAEALPPEVPAVPVVDGEPDVVDCSRGPEADDDELVDIGVTLNCEVVEDSDRICPVLRADGE